MTFYSTGNRLLLFCLSDFQYNHQLHLLLLHVNYNQRKSNNFHGLKIKTKGILGLKFGQIQVKIIVTYA